MIVSRRAVTRLSLMRLQPITEDKQRLGELKLGRLASFR